MDWPLFTIFGVAAIVLIVFVVIRNQKDKKEFEGHLKNDYHKTKDEEGDADVEEKMK